MTIQLTLSYYPWITQSIKGDDLYAAITKFKGLLEQELNKGVSEVEKKIALKVLREMPVAQQMEALKAPLESEVQGKIALMNPFGFAILHNQAAHVESIAVIRRQPKNDDPVGPFYRAQIYTNRKTAIKAFKFEQLRGRTLAFGSSESTSNFLAPALMLQKGGMHPLTTFKSIEFAGGHDLAAKAVYEGRAELGAGHDGVIIDLSNKPGYGDANEVLQHLAWTDPIPSDPVAVNIPVAALRDRVTKAFLAVAKRDDRESEGNKAVHGFWGTDHGFEAIESKTYLDLLAWAKELNLDPEKLLKKA